VVKIVYFFGSSEEVALARKASKEKEKSFSLPLCKQKTITQPSMVLFKICKCHLVQHMILIQMVYERSHGHKMVNHWKKNVAQF